MRFLGHPVGKNIKIRGHIHAGGENGSPLLTYAQKHFGSCYPI